MAKGSSKAKRLSASTAATGKVTPIQIAFFVERFLADNNYRNTLAAFRSEASDLFSMTKGKEVPKGLVGLGDILDEYISLKEQRIMVDQEKRRVEIAFQGLQDVMRAYNLPQSPPPILPAPNGAFCQRSNPGIGSPPQDIMSSGKAPCASNTGVNKGSTSAVNLTSTSSIVRSPLQGSSIAKSLFKNPTEIRSNSLSPKTPPQALQCQNDQSVSPIGNSSLNANDASSSQMLVPSSCAIISSERIIISPLKHKGYYAVERSYHVSPLKSSPEITNKREHIKGRLDFDESSARQSSEEPVVTGSSPSTTNGEAAGNFDFDLPDFDFFDGDFSKLLGDIDLDCEQTHSYQQSSTTAGFLPCLGQNVDDGCLEINQALPNPYLSTVTEVISRKDMNIQGSDTMTTRRSMTKRIMISSPSKNSSNC